MDQIAWILWMILGVGLIVAEIFTLGFVLFWFGLGAMAAALTAFLGADVGWQFFVFFAVSIGLTAMSRTIFAKYLPNNDPAALKMGMDSLPGQIGTVAAASKGSLQEAAVKVFGSTWTAFPEDGEADLIEGEKVEVVRVKGSSLYVRRVTAELPGWKTE